MERRAPNKPSSYGRACMPCFNSKCKCITRPDSDTCERCHRLKKKCYPSDSIRRRTAQKNQNVADRMGHLEGKLDGLMTLLQSVAHSPDGSDSLRRALDRQNSDDQMDAEGEVTILTPDPSSVGGLASATVSHMNDTNTVSDPDNAPCSAYSPIPTLAHPELSEDEAESYLSIFRTNMLAYFPFIHLPPEVTAQKLRHDRPFMFRAIVAVSSAPIEQKRANSLAFKRAIIEEMVLENESNIDLLLALLTFVAWSNDHIVFWKATLSRVMQLAMSIVHNLRLNKPEGARLFCLEMPRPRPEGEAETQVQRLERYRAVLACFLLSSVIAADFGQIDALRWTPQMEECLRVVSANKDCPTDEMFAYHVRLELLMQKLMQVREQLQMDFIQAAGTVSGAAPLSTSLYIQALHTQLKELRNSIPLHLQQKEFLKIHILYIEMSILETAHVANTGNANTAEVMDGRPAAQTLRPSFGDSSSITGTERLEPSWLALNTVKEYVDILYSLPTSACIGFSFLFSAQLSRAIVVLYRITVFDDPGWNRRAVRNVVDLLAVLDAVTAKIDKIGRETGEHSEEDLFAQCSTVLRRFRTWACAIIAPEEALDETACFFNGAATSAGEMMAGQNPMALQSINFDTDLWLETFLSRF